jgi:ABC-2 type transport system permease protein
MKKIFLISQREFLARVRKRSFWIMSFLGPVFFAVILIVPVWLGIKSEDGKEAKVIEVLDQTGKFHYKLPDNPAYRFAYFNGDLNGRMNHFLKSDHEGLLFISRQNIKDSLNATLFLRNEKSEELRIYIEQLLANALLKEKLFQSGTDPSKLANVALHTEFFSEGKEQNEFTARTIVALFSSILILFYILLYGGQVMRGVIEEKSNRILEIVISSVKPFQLMAGKIMGIGLVSLAQFTIWIILTLGLSYYFNQRYEKVFDAFSNEKIGKTLEENPQINPSTAFEINRLASAIDSVNFTYTLLVFLFFFIGGYLLYGAVFAGLASAVDSETDTQQFVFPLIAPLMFCMVFATKILQDPHGELAFWLSMIPFTSPVVILLRLPFDLPVIQLIGSMLILISSFIIFTWISARIYRVGILMYGKKASLREVGKWILYNSKF